MECYCEECPFFCYDNEITAEAYKTLFPSHTGSLPTLPLAPIFLAKSLGSRELKRQERVVIRWTVVGRFQPYSTGHHLAVANW